MTPQDFFKTLATYTGYAPGHEGALEKYRDYRAVFGTEQGNRVLHDILVQAGVNVDMHPSPGPIDPYKTHYDLGKRGLAMTIIGIINKEPPEQPTEQNRKE